MFRKLIFSIPFIAFSFAAQATADKYTFDKDHTHIIFFISHLGFSNTIGRIKEYDGHFSFDEQNPEKSEVDVTLKPESIDTSIPALDKVLREDKFFNVKKFPTIRFKSTKVQVKNRTAKAEGSTGEVTGDMTMLGVTKPVTLQVTYNKSGIHPYSNNYVSGFSMDAALKRSDFGMSAYIPAVGDDVRIHIEVEGFDPLKHPGNAKTPR